MTKNLKGVLGTKLGMTQVWDADNRVVAVGLTAVTMHQFWKESDAQAKMNTQIQFNKDLALAGAALGFYVLFANYSDQIGLLLLK